MRQIVVASLVFAAALPLGAQERTLDARFSQTAYAEPTFYVNRAAFVAVFEILGGDRVVQRYPRVEAQAATALPAGETALAWLDVNIGRVTDAPGTRTVFYRDGQATSGAGFPARAATARTMLLVASTQRLNVGASADFLPRFREALDRQPAGRDGQERVLAAVTQVVRPDDAGVEFVTYVETMWVVGFPEFRNSAVSAYANESYGYGSACDAIAPFGYAAYATWTDTSGCPSPFVAYFPGYLFFALPRHPFGYGPYAYSPRDRGPIGVAPAGPVPFGGSPGVHRAKPLTTQTLPAVNLPVEPRGGVVFASPLVDHRPIDGRSDGVARREAAAPIARRLTPEPVATAPAGTAQPSRSEPRHPEPYAPHPTAHVAEPAHHAAAPAPHPVVVVPAKPAPGRTTAPAPAAPRPAPAAAAVQHHTKRN